MVNCFVQRGTIHSLHTAPHRSTRRIKRSHSTQELTLCESLSYDDSCNSHWTCFTWEFSVHFTLEQRKFFFASSFGGIYAVLMYAAAALCTQQNIVFGCR